MVVAWYQNQSEITALYCINKTKPQLECNGKCHLNKQLSQIDQQDSSPSLPFPIEKLKNLELAQFLLNVMQFTLKNRANVNNTETKALHYQPALYDYLFAKGLFHPPSSLA